MGKSRTSIDFTATRAGIWFGMVERRRRREDGWGEGKCKWKEKCGGFGLPRPA